MKSIKEAIIDIKGLESSLRGRRSWDVSSRVLEHAIFVVKTGMYRKRGAELPDCFRAFWEAGLGRATLSSEPCGY